jgi:hypothetical protein
VGVLLPAATTRPRGRRARARTGGPRPSTARTPAVVAPPRCPPATSPSMPSTAVHPPCDRGRQRGGLARTGGGGQHGDQVSGRYQVHRRGPLLHTASISTSSAEAYRSSEARAVCPDGSAPSATAPVTAGVSRVRWSGPPRPGPRHALSRGRRARWSGSARRGRTTSRSDRRMDIRRCRTTVRLDPGVRERHLVAGSPLAPVSSSP